jgi:hypothetical protein
VKVGEISTCIETLNDDSCGSTIGKDNGSGRLCREPYTCMYRIWGILFDIDSLLLKCTSGPEADHDRERCSQPRIFDIWPFVPAVLRDWILRSFKASALDKARRAALAIEGARCKAYHWNTGQHAKSVCTRVLMAIDAL